MVRDDALGDGLADGVDLRGMAATSDADSDIDFAESVEAEDQERFVDLHSRRVSIRAEIKTEGCFGDWTGWV